MSDQGFSGSETVDPRKKIKINSDAREEIEFQRNLAVAPSSFEQRVNSLYSIFKQCMDPEFRTMKFSEFKHYEMLFSSEYRVKYLNNELSQDVVDQITELSREFAASYDLYKPYAILDDHTGKELFRIPPIFMRLNSLTGAATRAMDILADAIKKNDGTPTAMGDLYESKALKNITVVFNQSQNGEEILKRAQEFNATAQQFHKTVLGKPVFEEIEDGTTETVSNSISQGSSSDTYEIDDDFFD